MLHETTVSKTTTIEDLMAGNGFAAVHTTAMFLLASSPVDVTAETMPETLTFDVNRIVAAQHEYRRIVQGCATLVSAQYAIGGGNAALLPAQRDVLSKLTALVIDGGNVADEFPTILDEAGNMLPSTAARQSIINPPAAMLQLM